MKQHSVIFSMYENVDALRLKQFFVAARELNKIPGVLNFNHWKQVSNKNSFQYGLSMEFNSEEEFQKYNHHPTHAAFIEEQWMPCVSNFLEIDFELLEVDFL